MNRTFRTQWVGTMSSFNRWTTMFPWSQSFRLSICMSVLGTDPWMATTIVKGKNAKGQSWQGDSWVSVIDSNRWRRWQMT